MLDCCECWGMSAGGTGMEIGKWSVNYIIDDCIYDPTKRGFCCLHDCSIYIVIRMEKAK
jgi:hypothetical protein